MAENTQVFGTYILEERLHQSMEGFSYLAYKPENPKKKFFLKKLLADYSLNAAYRKHFEYYADRMSAFHLEGILSPVEYIFEDKELGVVYPYINRPLLADVLKEGKKTLEEINHMFTPMSGSLDILHEQGLVHGALHASNIMVKEDGSLLLLNMGICRVPSWMDFFPELFCRAPEQLFEKQNTEQADRYCFGMLIYACIAGSFPWPQKTTLEESIELRKNDSILSISSFVYSIDPDLLVAITKMLSLHPAERLSSCTDLINILDKAMLRVEESSELGIPPEELKKIQEEVDRLDQELSKLEKKIASYELRIKQAIQDRDQSLQRIHQKTKGIQDKYSPQIIEAEQRLNRLKNTKLTFFEQLQTRFSSKVREEKLAKEKELEDEWIRLAKERDEAIINENKRVEQEKEGISLTFRRATDKVRNVLDPLREKYQEIEEKFYEYGELNPRLLGFRAKKRFSIATIKVGNIIKDMKLLPSGVFQMGDSRSLNPDPDSLPKHEVSFSKPFWMTLYPVTQEFYRSVVGKNPSFQKHPKNPVEMVTWFDAVRFCNTLSLREGLNPVYDIIEEEELVVKWNKNESGYRLPTEAEWEYAARADSEFLYSGSNRANEVSWTSKNSQGVSHSVGKKKPNAWGLYDMSGNVWEWCWDWKGPYKKNSAADPIGAKEGNGRIFRGGSFLVKEDILPVSHRGFENPNVRAETVGFRLVRDAR